jgi:hypothetical protein
LSCRRSGCSGSPPRRAIDGGIAAAIRDEAVRGRTLTVYTDLRRVTIPLAIGDRSAIWLCLVDRAGRVAWRASGGLDPVTAAALDTALATPPESAASAPAQAAGPEAEQFEMAFDPRLRLPLATLGVTPAAACVTVAADRLVACFGPWVCRTTPANVRAVRGRRSSRRSGRGRPATAGSACSCGNRCAASAPLGLIRHPNLTLTAADASPAPTAGTARSARGS